MRPFECGPIEGVGCGLGNDLANTAMNHSMVSTPLTNHPAEDSRMGNTLLQTSVNHQILDGKTRADNTMSEMVSNVGNNVRCTIVGNVACMESVVAGSRDKALNGMALHSDLTKGKLKNDISTLGKGTIMTKKQNQKGTFKEGQFEPSNGTMMEQIGNRNGRRSCGVSMPYASILEERSGDGTGNGIFNSARNGDISCGNGEGEVKKMTCLQVKGEQTVPLWGEAMQTTRMAGILNQEGAKGITENGHHDGRGQHHDHHHAHNNRSNSSSQSGSSRKGGTSKVTIDGGANAKLMSEDTSTTGCSSIVHMTQVADTGLNGKGANKLNYCAEQTYLEGINLSASTWAIGP